MAKTKVFFSFHYDKDVFRTQLVRNMGAIEKNQEVTPQDWEKLKRDSKILSWIKMQMEDKDAVVILIGEETSTREWVKEEIKHAWNTKKPLLGVYIHNLKCARTGQKSKKGKNPFDQFTVGNKKLSDYINCYDPNQDDAYNDISTNLSKWIQASKK